MFLHRLWLVFFWLLNKFKFFENYFLKDNLNNKLTLKTTPFFKKIFLSLFPLKNSPQSLINFRKNNFPITDYFYSTSYKYNYKTKFGLKSFNKALNVFSIKPDSVNFFKKENFAFNFYCFLIFFKKNYYYLFANVLFNTDTLSFYKLNLVAFLLKKNEYQLKRYNLDKYTDWYNYTNSSVFYFLKQKGTSLIETSFINHLVRYKAIYDDFSKSLGFKYNNFLSYLPFFFKKDITNIVFFENFKKGVEKYFPIRFNESSTNKHIQLNNVSNYCFFYIRKNRIFNKGRYSRNRQTYRTGVYWCLWVNILSVFGLYFIFYRVTFNFGYLWLPLIIFFGSMIFSRILKYNFFNLRYVLLELINLFKWVSLLYFNFTNSLISFFNAYFKLNSLFEIVLSNANLQHSHFNKINTVFLKRYINWSSKNELLQFNYVWAMLNEKDDSFLKFKTLVKTFTQFSFFFKK